MTDDESFGYEGIPDWAWPFVDWGLVSDFTQSTAYRQIAKVTRTEDVTISIDPKAEARNRSREDLKRQRRQMRGKNGNRYPTKRV